MAESLKINWVEVNMFFCASVGKDQRGCNRDTTHIGWEMVDTSGRFQKPNQSTPFVRTKLRARSNRLILFVNSILLNCMLTRIVLCKKDRDKKTTNISHAC